MDRRFVQEVEIGERAAQQVVGFEPLRSRFDRARRVHARLFRVAVLEAALRVEQMELRRVGRAGIGFGKPLQRIARVAGGTAAQQRVDRHERVSQRRRHCGPASVRCSATIRS